MRPILYVLLSFAVLFATGPQSVAAGKGHKGQQAGAANACVRCTTRCGQCSGSDSCVNACKANGNPWVKANAVCGTWYEECRSKNKK